MNPLLKKPKLLWFVKDTTAPTLTTVTFASDNTDTTLAIIWDTVTLAFVPSEPIQNVLVTINWKNVTPTQLNPLSYTVSYTILAWDTSWVMPFTIDFKDINWNAWTRVTATTWSETVTCDATAPELASAERIANTTIRVTISEDCLDATITKANAWWFVVYQTWTPATTYAVSAIAKNGWNADEIDLTVASILASAATWVTVTYVAWWNGTVADLNWNTMLTNATWVLVAAWA